MNARNAIFFHFQHLPNNEDVEIVPEIEYCQSERMGVFLSTIYAYKGLLMVSSEFPIREMLVLIPPPFFLLFLKIIVALKEGVENL